MSSSSAAAAAAKAVQDREEEERLADYTNTDLNNDWEFKILRATDFTGFKNPEKLRSIIDQESKNRWVFVEKFDDRRLRFKRKRSFTNQSVDLQSDAYRTTYGPSEIQILIYVFTGIGAFILLTAYIGMSLETLFSNL